MNYETYGGVFNVDLNAGAIPAGKYGIPTILRTGSVPNQLIPFDKAVSSEDHDQWVHFFIHDYQFIRIWRNPWRYLPILAEYNGIISPDFSVFWNYPLYMQLESVCRSREIGAWLQRNGLEVIPCLRWGKPDTYEFAFDGVQPNGTVAVGTLGCVRDRDARKVFEDGFRTMIEAVAPKTVIVYGSIELPAMDYARSAGVEIVGFEDATTCAHREKRCKHGVR